MTIQQIQAEAAALAAQIQQQVRDFEAATGCIVHSLPVHNDKQPTTVQVKVQIP